MPAEKPQPKTASTLYESHYHAQGYQWIAGIDEAGRGAWAGPVSAGAVCLPLDDFTRVHSALIGVYDSKALSARQREKLIDTIKSVALGWGIGHATHDEIDAHGIVPATKLAMQRAVEQLTTHSGITPDCLLLDGMYWREAPFKCQQVRIPKGDRLSLSIASASILAKTWRDAHLHELDTHYPVYGFARHKGYGTRAHLSALTQYGVSAVHRRTFAPVKRILNPHESDTLL